MLLLFDRHKGCWVAQYLFHQVLCPRTYEVFHFVLLLLSNCRMLSQKVWLSHHHLHQLQGQRMRLLKFASQRENVTLLQKALRSVYCNTLRSTSDTYCGFILGYCEQTLMSALHYMHSNIIIIVNSSCGGCASVMMTIGCTYVHIHMVVYYVVAQCWPRGYSLVCSNLVWWCNGVEVVIIAVFTCIQRVSSCSNCFCACTVWAC